MIVCYTTVITSLIAFILCVFYYKILFSMPIIQETNEQTSSKSRRLVLWVVTYINILAIALAYAVLGYYLKIFILAPQTTPYVLSFLIWLIITSTLIMSASRTKQSQLITFIHSGYWLVAMLLFAIIFPFLTNHLIF